MGRTEDVEGAMGGGAAKDARRAAAAACVQVVEVTDEPTARLVAAVGEDVWGPGGVFTPAELQAMSFAGNPIHLVLDSRPAPAGEPTVLGFAIGFLGWSPGLHVHSHQTAVLPGARRRGVGLALKLAQRETCLAHGITEMRWTFDPLVRRNTAFNLVALGARAVSFHADFYGVMTDTINAGDRSDRVQAVWDLTQPAPSLAPARLPGPSGPVLLAASAARPVQLEATPAPGSVIEVPHDYESLRATDPLASKEWRMAVRQVLVTAYDAGLEIATVTAAGYVLGARR